MKKRFFAFIFMILFTCLGVTPVAAIAARASGQIVDAYTNVSVCFGGEVQITYDVEGKGKMKELGAEEIMIYRRSGSKWIKADSYDRNDDGMTKANAGQYKNTVTFDGTSGTEYKIVITVFAEDSSGYDSRTKTHYVTAK